MYSLLILVNKRMINLGQSPVPVAIESPIAAINPMSSGFRLAVEVPVTISTFVFGQENDLRLLKPASMMETTSSGLCCSASSNLAGDSSELIRSSGFLKENFVVFN